MKRIAIVLALGLFAVSATAYAWRDVQLQRIIRNLHKVQSFDGTLVQSGLLPDQKEVTAEVRFARPNRFAARIVEPKAWAGTSITYDGTTLVHHFPAMRYAIRFKNLVLPSGDEADRLIEYQYQRDLARYEYAIRGTSKVADLPAITLSHSSKDKGAIDVSGWTKVYDNYSFALAGELDLKDGVRYGYRYARIAFNGAADDKAFEAELPEGTLVAEWDLSAPPVDEADMKRDAAFTSGLFGEHHLGMSRTRIVRIAGPIPAYCMRYERGGHFVLAIAFAAQGIAVPEYGLPIKVRGQSARLNISPMMSSLAFVDGGTYYSFMGNLPFDELVRFADAR